MDILFLYKLSSTSGNDCSEMRLKFVNSMQKLSLHMCVSAVMRRLHHLQVYDDCA